VIAIFSALFDRLRADPAFASVKEVLLAEDLDPGQFTGRSAQQVEEFLSSEVDPLLQRWESLLGAAPEVTV